MYEEIKFLEYGCAQYVNLTLFYLPELQLMFKLMDRVPDGISPMLDDLVDHILQAGLDDMLASADIITQVNLV